MLDKNSLIIYSANPNEIYNRKSAIGSYIFELSKCLNQLGFSTNLKSSTDKIKEKDQSQKLKTHTNNNIKRYVPKSIQLLIKELIQLHKIKNLKKEFAKYVSINNTQNIIEFYNKFSNIGYYLKKKYNPNYIIIYDGPIDEEYLFFNKKRIKLFSLYIRREKKSLLNADTIIVYSDAVKEHLCNKYKQLSKDKIKTHQNVDFSRLDFENKSFDKSGTVNFGFIGGFLKWHRVDLLVKVFEALLDEGLDANLYLVGHGQEYNNILEMVAQSKYKTKIFMPGFLDGEELLKVKRKLDIGIMPSSNWYGAPNKLFEYGAMGLACIAPSTPTIDYIFKDREHLLLFKNNDFESLKECMYELATNTNLQEKLSQNIFNYIKSNFNKEKTVEFYSELLNK